MQNQNVITCEKHTFKVANSQRPFSNNFVMLKSEIVQYEGVDEILAVVECTSNSNEPGRVYAVSYSFKGEMLGCNTLN